MNGLVANLMNCLVTVFTRRLTRLATRFTRLCIIHEQPSDLYHAQHEVLMNNLVGPTGRFTEQSMGNETPGSNH